MGTKKCFPKLTTCYRYISNLVIQNSKKIFFYLSYIYLKTWPKGRRVLVSLPRNDLFRWNASEKWMKNVTLAFGDEQPQAHRVIFFICSQFIKNKVGKMNYCQCSLFGNPLRMMEESMIKLIKWILQAVNKRTRK